MTRSGLSYYWVNAKNLKPVKRCLGRPPPTTPETKTLFKHLNLDKLTDCGQLKSVSTKKTKLNIDVKVLSKNLLDAIVLINVEVMGIFYQDGDGDSDEKESLSLSFGVTYLLDTIESWSGFAPMATLAPWRHLFQKHKKCFKNLLLGVAVQVSVPRRMGIQQSDQIWRYFTSLAKSLKTLVNFHQVYLVFFKTLN